MVTNAPAETNRGCSCGVSSFANLESFDVLNSTTNTRPQVLQAIAAKRLTIMRIEMSSPAKGEVVEFSSKIGRGRAHWKGASAEGYLACDIEFTIASAAARGTNAMPGRPNGFQISLIGDATLLAGLVEGVDEDGVFYFRLAPDCLVLVDAEPGTFRAGEWIEITCPPDELLLYPIGA